MPKDKKRRSLSPSTRRSNKHDDKRRQKELIKTTETAEEKRKRRLKKKEDKEKRLRAKMGWDEEMMGYTNTDNPFGDQQLLDKFVWSKKREQQAKKMNLSEKELDINERKRKEDMKRELEKVKKRRIEREKERETRDDEMTLLQRLKETDMFKEWESQEDQFHLEQAKIRSKIRIEQGRAKPIDLIAKYINTNDEDMSIEMQEPYHLLIGLNVGDLEDLIEDIKVYLEVEKDTHYDYWKDMMLICEDELHKLQKLEQDTTTDGNRTRNVINPSVLTDVSSIFKGKTYGQLIALEKELNDRIHGDNPGDISWWESSLQQLKSHMAKARLRDRHQGILRKALFQLKQESDDDHSDNILPVESKETSPIIQDNDELIGEVDLVSKAYEMYQDGGYSPVLMKITDFPDNVILIDEIEDMTIRDENRTKLLTNTKMAITDSDVSNFSHISMTRQIGDDGIAEEEFNFNTQIVLQTQNYVWQGKYKPRKPRFFNRVHTGFEWNKYNQTHYDTDNPPPKIVQGYKFNIFYPDLIKKRDTPEYRLTVCDDNNDFAILRFHAGPPYEDIAFKIVNREWEYSWKYGFKSQFNNNILQLWFRFKRYRYRR